MKRVAENDILELLLGDRGGVETLMFHPLKNCDDRARLVIDLVKTWGIAHILGEAITEHRPHVKALRGIETLVFIAAETVDTIYGEINRRGWLLTAPRWEAE